MTPAIPLFASRKRKPGASRLLRRGSACSPLLASVLTSATVKGDWEVGWGWHARRPGVVPRASTEGLSVIDKFRADVLSVLDVVPSGASLAVGGFGSSGRPDTLLDALCDLDRRDLHLIVNNVGSDFTGVGRMLAEGRIRRLTASFPVLPEFYDEYFAGRVEFELVPQGTLAERLRAGGAGLPAFFPPPGAG